MKKIGVLFTCVAFILSCAAQSERKLYQSGLASWYGEAFHGRKTASGEVFDMNAMTAAHPILPFGTWILVESPSTGKSVHVRINDRGPFTGGRILDLSYAAAKQIGLLQKGHAQIKIYLRR